MWPSWCSLHLNIINGNLGVIDISIASCQKVRRALAFFENCINNFTGKLVITLARAMIIKIIGIWFIV